MNTNTNDFDITDLTALNAMAAQDTVSLTREQATTLTKAIKENLNTLPTFIMLCLKGKAYKAMKYTSVSEWAQAEFGLSRSRIYQLNIVATAEHAMRNQFNLSAGFTLAEGQFRPLGGDLGAVLNTIAADLAACDIADTESARESVVHDSISKMIRALEQKERDAKAAARAKAAPVPAAITDIVPTAETASADNVVSFTPRSENAKHIGAVPMSYELALVKAKDTGHVLRAPDMVTYSV
ncbi:hypothetical protein [Arthrobacter sp. SO3]|uniref:hypothetical protein n=1 Tax=Arthrobacter sp. SO3 TaxID=1897057 RepID=UPI001CFFC4A5|nr:hypothetical protein [Arthrobacter sp. SO3]MCB5294275.1 hypothetical protein [Arthrobacter sp. SO3]